MRIYVLPPHSQGGAETGRNIQLFSSRDGKPVWETLTTATTRDSSSISRPRVSRGCPARAITRERRSARSEVFKRHCGMNGRDVVSPISARRAENNARRTTGNVERHPAGNNTLSRHPGTRRVLQRARIAWRYAISCFAKWHVCESGRSGSNIRTLREKWTSLFQEASGIHAALFFLFFFFF